MKKIFSIIGKILHGVFSLIGPIMKTIGLLFVILGAIFCFTFIGAIIGIPLIIVGGLLLFV